MVKDKAQPFETAPKDGTPILAFHKIWKCWTGIMHRVDGNHISQECEWIDCTFANIWPREAFTHWREMHPPPEVD